MKKSLIFPPILAAFLLTGCIATAPVTFAWRANTSQQYATTDGRTVKEADANTVNADRTSELQNAVSTSSGTASTAEQPTPPPEFAPAPEAAAAPDAAGEEAAE